MNPTLRFFGLLVFSFISLSAQKADTYIWHNPSISVTKFQGQGWENIGFSRFPDKAEKLVRNAVWNLSRNSAGLGVRFSTDAKSLTIRYQVDGNLAMNHMPSTGVSGVDLYVKSGEKWLWCKGGFQFKDTIQYNFKMDGLPNEVHEYQLLFPLYNTIKNLKIGIPDGLAFEFIAPREEKPIAVYGTSIAQGACASRPGMAWTNILSRKMDYPIINLGFSGNGRLESEVIDLLTEIDASVYVLDCLPNLPPNRGYTKEDVQKRIQRSVTTLFEKRPNALILLVEHAGYSDGLVDSERKGIYETLNSWTKEIFEDLKNIGFNNLYLLTKEDIGLTNDAFVDGTHPTDLGMQQYAEAYAKRLQGIMNK